MTDRIALSDAVVDHRVGQGARPRGIHPAAMPRIRDQVARFVADPDGPLAENFPRHADGFDLVVRHLGAADLYWVTPDMAALAVSAGSQLDTIRWTNHDRPSGCGLIVFAGGVGLKTVDGADIPVDAMVWGPRPDGIAVTLMCGRWRLSTEARENKLPPLLIMSQDDVGGGDGEVPVDTIPARTRTLLTALAATWALMQQPTIADTTRGPVERRLARAYRRTGRPVPVVQIIDLRTIYRPDREHDDTGSGREYRHRWVVRGHWREQAHGTGRALRKRIYVPSYIKGPDGAPLLAREKVNVWRR